MSLIKILFIQFLIVIIFFIFDFSYTKFIKKLTLSSQKIEQTYRVKHETFHHTLLPSFRGFGYWGSKKYQICSDSNGFKSSCDNFKKQKHFEVAFIGDSFTEAIGMTFEQSFVGIFSENNPNLSVANLAVNSYAPTVYFSKLKYLLSKDISFDHVIVFIDISDIYDETKYYRDISGNVKQLNFPQGENKDIFEDENNLTLKKIKGFIQSNFILFSKTYKLIKKNFFLNVKINLPNSVIDRPQSAWTSNLLLNSYGELGVRGAIDKAIVEMDKLHKLLYRNNIKLSIGVYPWPEQLIEIYKNKNEENLQSKIWREFCYDRCVHFIDLFPVFASLLKEKNIAQVYQKYYIYGDIHFNEDGNKLIFEHISNLSFKDVKND